MPTDIGRTAQWQKYRTKRCHRSYPFDISDWIFPPVSDFYKYMNSSVHHNSPVNRNAHKRKHLRMYAVVIAD